MENPFLKRARESQKTSAGYKHSRKQERKLANKLGGRTTLASGALREKGDVRVKGKKRIECKCTQHKSFSITLEMVEKIKAAALLNDETPYIQVDFITKEGKLLEQVAVVPMFYLDNAD